MSIGNRRLFRHLPSHGVQSLSKEGLAVRLSGHTPRLPPRGREADIFHGPNSAIQQIPAPTLQKPSEGMSGGGWILQVVDNGTC